jgi:hypothetical protein
MAYFRRSEGKKQARVQQSPEQDYARKGIGQGEFTVAFGLELVWLLFSDERCEAARNRPMKHALRCDELSYEELRV